jgi:hypothetical protein
MRGIYIYRPSLQYWKLFLNYYKEGNKMAKINIREPDALNHPHSLSILDLFKLNNLRKNWS